MTFYCMTNELSPEYILRAILESMAELLRQLPNCLTQFEEKDVSEIARCLVACVKESYRSYGMTMIVDYCPWQ